MQRALQASALTGGDAGAPAPADPPTAAIHPVLTWLQTDAVRFRDTLPFVEAFAAELLRAGVAVSRITTGVPILHPQIDSSSCLWEAGRPASERRFIQEGAGLQQYQNSPMPGVYAGAPFRQSLERAPEPNEFPILAELREGGSTDYVALPLPFSDASWKAVTYVTRRPGGFRAEHLQLLEDLVPAVARVLEIQTLHRTNVTLLDTYVGPVAGRRVLDGAIRRGMLERIEAVIWACDLRGFTELSEALPGDELIALLNDYFGAMTEAVARNGGEVLKFIGDALLAIFPLAGAEGGAVARRALAAAGEAERAITEVNAERLRAGRPPIRFGLALHVGEALYGNIGGAGRLDFTVIGQAVNVAMRIEGLTKILGRTVLLSHDFAELCGRRLEPLGVFALKGVGAEQPIYAKLRSEAEPP